MQHGIVIKSTGSWYSVLDAEGNKYDCRLRGKFKKDGMKSTNPIAVGDRVRFSLEAGEQSGIIHHIEDRKNYIIRKATNLSRQTHIIAANLDQVIIIATIAEPRTSSGFIDRILVTCEAYSLPAIIVFNKYDLVRKRKEESLLDEYLNIYEKAGYSCMNVSATEQIGLHAFAETLKDKFSLLSGHSGVGKSSLINAIEPGIQLKVQSISQSHQKGRHTTTFAEMLPLSDGGYIIDTPGIKEFGLADFQPEELSHFFPEMRALFNQCRFDNCTHLNEPGCAVKEHLEKGNISLSRYNNYINMLLGRETRG